MKKILIDYNKCTGCRQCEAVCSLKHYENEINPRKSRIRIFMKGEHFVPVIAGPPAEAECTCKNNVIVAGEEYDECTRCRVSCPVRPWFREPETNIALKCDFCGDPPDPSCVAVCLCDALTMIEA